MEHGHERVLKRQKLSDHDLLELHAEGLMDVEIAEIMDVSISTVNKRKKKLGLPKNKQHNRNANQWAVYDWETGDCIVVGTVREIAEKLYIAESTVYYYAKCGKYGAPCRYRVCAV